MMLRRSGVLMDHRESELVRPRRARRSAIGGLVLGACVMVGSPVRAWAEAPPPTAAAAGKPAPASDEGGANEAGPLRVTVEPRIEDATAIVQWIGERNAARLKAPADPEEWIEVRIGGATYAYRVEVRAMRGGKPVGAAREPAACDCTSEEMLTLVDEEVARAVEELARPVVEEPEPVEPEPEPTVPPGGEPSEEPRKGLTWKGKTGAALAGVGGAGVIAGVVMIAMGEGAPLSGLQSFQRDLRNPAGYVTVGVGGALLVSGVTMLAVDLWCMRHPSRCGTKGREQARSGRSFGRGWSLGPKVPMATGTGERGLSISGRF